VATGSLRRQPESFSPNRKCGSFREQAGAVTHLVRVIQPGDLDASVATILFIDGDED
jgi:hypothetical protein